MPIYGMWGSWSADMMTIDEIRDRIILRCCWERIEGRTVSVMGQRNLEPHPWLPRALENRSIRGQQGCQGCAGPGLAFQAGSTPAANGRRTSAEYISANSDAHIVRDFDRNPADTLYVPGHNASKRFLPPTPTPPQPKPIAVFE